MSEFIETPEMYEARVVLDTWGPDADEWPERSVERYAIRIAHAYLRAVGHPFYDEQYKLHSKGPEL